MCATNYFFKDESDNGEKNLVFLKDICLGKIADVEKSLGVPYVHRGLIRIKIYILQIYRT